MQSTGKAAVARGKTLTVLFAVFCSSDFLLLNN